MFGDSLSKYGEKSSDNIIQYEGKVVYICDQLLSVLYIFPDSDFSVITIKPSIGDASLTGSPLSPGEVITIPLDWFTGIKQE